jgi:hypothetical protein
MVDNQHIQHHLDRITDKKFFIVAISDLILDYSNSQIRTDLNIDLSYINTCSSDYDIILIDYTTPYVRDDIEEIIFKQLEQHTLPKPWLIITSNFKFYKQQHKHIVYYPLHLIDGIDRGVETLIEIKNQRTHNLCFLTYHLHWHRILVLLSIYQRLDFTSCLINLPTTSALSKIQLQILNDSFRYLTKEEQQLVEQIFELAPLIADPTDTQEEIVNIENRAFYDSYINIFTESDYASPIVTEKSIKPFLSGQFFAVLGHPSAYLHLKDLGFDLFEDYLPMPQHNDLRQNLKELMDSICNLLPKINSVWDSTYHRRLHNYTLARNPKLKADLCYELSTRLNSI